MLGTDPIDSPWRVFVCFTTFYWCKYFNITPDMLTLLFSYTTNYHNFLPRGMYAEPDWNLLAGLHIYQGECLKTVVDVLHWVLMSGVTPPSRLEVSGVMGSSESLLSALAGLTDYHHHLRLSGLDLIRDRITTGVFTAVYRPSRNQSSRWSHGCLWCGVVCGLHNKLFQTVSSNNLTYNPQPAHFTLTGWLAYQIGARNFNNC